jgi:hypothetical protein
MHAAAASAARRYPAQHDTERLHDGDASHGDTGGEKSILHPFGDCGQARDRRAFLDFQDGILHRCASLAKGAPARRGQLRRLFLSAE